jgi:hypothetical protein
VRPRGRDVGRSLLARDFLARSALRGVQAQLPRLHDGRRRRRRGARSIQRRSRHRLPPLRHGERSLAFGDDSERRLDASARRGIHVPARRRQASQTSLHRSGTGSDPHNDARGRRHVLRLQPHPHPPSDPSLSARDARRHGHSIRSRRVHGRRTRQHGVGVAPRGPRARRGARRDSPRRPRDVARARERNTRRHGDHRCLPPHD